MAISDYSTTPASNTSISGIDISGTTGKVKDGDNAIRQLMADIRSAVDSVASFSGLLYGLTLANNGSDATNDIDIATGVAIDSTNAAFMTLGSALTKRLDASWAVGTNQGGLDTGSIANTTYHVWLIKRTDTGVVDVLFSTSASSPTMPANYTLKRRIGSIIRAGATILAFTQNGDRFMYKSAPVDYSSTSGRASAALALASIPTGISVTAIGSVALQQGTVGDCYLAVAPIGGSVHIVARTVVASQWCTGHFELPTDTSAQILLAAVIGGGTISAATIQTVGWIDTRGQLG